jgi:hypothetical protein
MKLLDILKELNKPEKIYADREAGKELTIADLTPEEFSDLLKNGSILIPIKDPSRPGASTSQVINLPKMDQIKREIIKNKQEFEIFNFSSDDDIKSISKEINKLYNKLYKAMNALDKTIELKKRGRI